MKKPTQQEIITRLLWQNKNEWIPSYDLLKRNTEWGFIGSQGDRRAREIAEQGYYGSPTYRYIIERSQKGKYAHYRCTGRVKNESLEDLFERL